MRCFAFIWNSLFIQDVPRKRKVPDQIQVTWEGSTVNTAYGLHCMLSQGYWDRTKKIARKMAETLNNTTGKILRKGLLSH